MKAYDNLQLKTASHLGKEPLLKDAGITVEILDREVILSGQVNRFFKKGLACKIAREISGISTVTDHIQVVLSHPEQFTDANISKAITEKFEKNFGSSYQFITVEVIRGNVTLSGILKWQYQVTLAEDCINYVDGIVSIRNNITTGIPPEPQISEKDILAAIYKEELVTSDISVSLHGRKVIITGSVATPFQKKFIESIVTRLPGIDQVESRLELEKKHSH